MTTPRSHRVNIFFQVDEVILFKSDKEPFTFVEGIDLTKQVINPLYDERRSYITTKLGISYASFEGDSWLDNMLRKMPSLH